MSNSKSKGVSFFGLLTILFIGLKLTNYIQWSWWVVMAPLWVPVTITMGIAVLVGLVATSNRRY